MTPSTAFKNSILTDEEFDHLHQQIDKARGNLVKVKRDALAHLLVNHSNLLHKLKESSS